MVFQVAWQRVSASSGEDRWSRSYDHIWRISRIDSVATADQGLGREGPFVHRSAGIGSVYPSFRRRSWRHFSALSFADSTVTSVVD